MKYLSLIGIFVFFLILRDCIYRNIYIYPRVKFKNTGGGAARIEQWDVFRWIIPRLYNEDIKETVLFIGNSHIMDGVNPHIIEKISSKKTFNLAIYGLNSLNVLDVLLKINRYPKIILIDISTRYAIYDRKLNIEYYMQNRKNESMYLKFLDSYSWIFPSLAVPKKYGWILCRGIKKYIKFVFSGEISFGRYSPFQAYCSYKWILDKSVNHRMAIKVKQKKSRQELYKETIYLKKAISETRRLCKIDSKEYVETLQYLKWMICRLLEKNVEIIFVRMPLDKRIVKYENSKFFRYFDDIKKILGERRLELWDLNSNKHSKNIGELEFYNDGQHLYAHSAVNVSCYLGEMLKKYFERRKKKDDYII